MAAPAYRSNAGATAAASGSITLTVPSDVVADDIMLVISVGASTSTMGTMNTPTETGQTWTEVDETQATKVSYNPSIRASLSWRRVASTSERGNTVTLAHSGFTGEANAVSLFQGLLVVYSGCETSGNPWDEVIATANVEQDYHYFNAVTVSGSERTLVGLWCEGDNTAISTGPASYTQRALNTTATSIDGSVGCWDYANRSSDGQVYVDGTWTSEIGVTFHISLKPPSTERTITSSPQLTGMTSSSATVAEEFIITSSAPQLTGALSSSATIAGGPEAVTINTSAPQLTGALSASATIDYTPPARTSTAASQLTGAVTASATMTYTPPARTSTAASQLTGAISASATLRSNSLVAASTLTGPLSASATVAENFTVTSTPQLTGMTSAAATVAQNFQSTSAPQLTGALSSAATVTNTPPARTMTAASQLTGMTSASTTVTNTPPARTLTSAPQLTGAVSADASLTAGTAAVTLTAASQLTGMTSSSATVGYTPPARTMTAASTLTGMTSSNGKVSLFAYPTVVHPSIAGKDYCKYTSLNVMTNVTPVMSVGHFRVFVVDTDTNTPWTVRGTFAASGSSGYSYDVVLDDDITSDNYKAYVYAYDNVNDVLGPYSESTLFDLVEFQLTAASQLTGMTSSSASVTNTPPARTMTSAPQLTGMLSSSASINNGAGVTLTAASELLLHNARITTMSAASDLSIHSYGGETTPATVTAASTLTGKLSGAASVSNGSVTTIVAASTLTEYAPQPFYFTSAPTLTGRVSGSASIGSRTVSGASTLTGKASGSASISTISGAVTMTAASELTGHLLCDSIHQLKFVASSAPTLTGVTSASSDLWSFDSSSSHVIAASTLTGAVTTSTSLGSWSLVSSPTIKSNIGSVAEVEREFNIFELRGDSTLTSAVSPYAMIRVYKKRKCRILYPGVRRLTTTTKTILHRGGKSLWP